MCTRGCLCIIVARFINKIIFKKLFPFLMTFEQTMIKRVMINLSDQFSCNGPYENDKMLKQRKINKIGATRLIYNIVNCG